MLRNPTEEVQEANVRRPKAEGTDTYKEKREKLKNKLKNLFQSFESKLTIPACLTPL